MIVPINERFASLTEAFRLTTENTSALNQAISGVASLQIPQVNSVLLPSRYLSNNTFEGLSCDSPGQVFTSQGSRLSSPFSSIYQAYRYVADKVSSLLGASSESSETVESLALADKTLLHQFGDFFGKDTGLEGYSQIEAFKFYRALILDVMSREGESENLQRMVANLANAISLSIRLFGKVDELRMDLRTALEKLNPKESVFLSGGWVGNPSGHAVVYEIIRQNNGSFTFRIYNSGSGLEYHISKTHHLKEKVVPFVEISNISIEKILARPFLRLWQMMKTQIDYQTPWEGKDVYNVLVKHLGGEVGIINYGKEDLMTPQRSGTCAFMSLEALFYHMNADKKVSQKIRYQLLSSGISNYIKMKKNRLGKELQAQNLFSKSLEEYSRITADMHGNEIITDKELMQANQQIKEFHHLLKSAQNEYRQNIEKNIKIIDLDNYQSFQGRNEIPNVLLMNPGHALSESKPSIVHLPILKDWKPSQEKMIGDLNNFIDFFKKDASEKSCLSVFLEIERLVKKLDLTSLNFTKEETTQVIAQLRALGMLYYENIQRSCGQHPEMHCQIITPKMFLTINTLIFQASTLLDKFYPNVYSELVYNYFSASDNRAMRHPVMRFMDPELDDQYRKLERLIFEQKDIKALPKKEPVEEKSVSIPFVLNSNIFSKYFIENKGSEIPKGVKADNLPLFKFFNVTNFNRKDYFHQRNHFPSEFYDLFDLNLLGSIALERLPVSETSMTDKSLLRIEKKSDFKILADNVQIFENKAFFHPMSPLDKEYPKGTTYENLVDYHFRNISSNFKDSAFREILKIKKENFSLLKELNLGKPLQNSYLVKDPLPSLSLQKFRELTGLLTCRALQIKETLSYFNEHPALLVSSDNQALFINLMFTPGLLLEELQGKDGHLIADHLSKFAVKNFNHFKSLGDMKTAAFFLQMNRLFETYAAYGKIKPAPIFLDTRAEIRLLLNLQTAVQDNKVMQDFEFESLSMETDHSQKVKAPIKSDYGSKDCVNLLSSTPVTRLNLEQKDSYGRWLLNQELILSYEHEKNLTDEQAEEFMLAAFSVNTRSNTGYFDETWNQLRIEELLQKHTDAFIRLTNGNDKDHILNRLAEIYLNLETSVQMDKKWIADPAYPYFKTVDGEYKINLYRCYMNFESNSRLPKEIAFHPDVLKIFNNELPKTFTRIGKNGFLISYKGSAYRIFQQDDKVVIQREFNEHGMRIWGQFFKIDLQENHSLPEFLAKTSMVWVCGNDGKDGGKPARLLLTDHKNKVIARVDREQIRQVDPITGENTGLILDKNVNTPLSEAISRFEDRGYTAVWVYEKTGRLEQIDFPRLGNSGVSFKRHYVNGKDRMVSDSFSGFYLAEKQYLKELQNDFSFLLLENSEGEQSVILAKQYFKIGHVSRKMEQKVLETSKDYLEKDLHTPYLSKQDYYQYKVNPATGKLTPPSLAAQLYLSLRYLWKMRYEDAEILLRGYNTFLRPYTMEERDILNQFPMQRFWSGDQDPRSTALSLYASYLLEKNRVDFNFDFSGDSKSVISKKYSQQLRKLKTANRYESGLRKMKNMIRQIPESDVLEFLNAYVIAELYPIYLNQLNNIHGVRLAPEEELILLDRISDKTEAMINRLIELDPAKGKVAQAQFSQVVPEIFENENPHPKLCAGMEITFALFYWNSIGQYPPPPRTRIQRSLFGSICELIQSQNPNEKHKKAYKSLLGLDFPGKEIDWRKELALTLRIMTESPYPLSNTMAWILLAFLEFPDEIPVEEWLNSKTAEEMRNIYEQTIVPKLHSLYPELDKEESSPFILAGQKADIIEKSPPEVQVPQPAQSMEYQHSIAIKSPLFFELPYVDRAKELVSQQVKEAQDNKNTQQQLEQLQEIFSSLPGQDPVVKYEMRRILNSIDMHRRFTGTGEEQIYLTSTQGLIDYANRLSDSIVEAQTTLRHLELDLLRKINRPPADSVNRAKGEILDLGHSREPMTIDEVIRLYWKRDAACFHEFNPDLSVDEIYQLESEIQTMLVQATHVQQLKRVLKQIDLIKNDPDSEELQEQFRLLKTLVEGVHAYDIGKHPEYLVLEYYADILLRPEQVKNLDLLQIRDGKIHNRKYFGTALEMMMGAGKTTVLLPLLSILNADGDNLSIGVLPSALLPSMSDLLAERLGTSFKQTVEVVEIERETPINEAFLNRLQNIREDKKLMLMTDSSIQSLYLNFIEHLNLYSQASEAVRLSLESERQVFVKIFRLLKKHSSLVIDEVDQILNPRTEKLYTLGDAAVIPVHEIELVATLYEILESDPAITEALSFEFSPESTIKTQEELNLQKPFLKKTYEEAVKHRLIDAMIQKRMGVKNHHAVEFFKNLSEQEMVLVKHYLSTQSDQSVAFVSKQIPVIKDLLALAKEEIQNLLPLTCVKLSYQNYGPGVKGDYAIPFHGSDAPALRSQFGTVYETLNYTFQLLIKQGINKKMIARAVNFFRDKALQELKENPEKTLEETTAYRQFIKLIGRDKSIPLFGSDIIDKVQEIVNGSVTLKLQFIKTFVAPQIKIYEKTISANPQIYNFLFSIVNAFTGTQWNADTFPEGLNIIPDEVITGKTLGLLWKNRQESIHITKIPTAKTVLNELIVTNPQALKANALIDTAGMIRGISRELVARQLLKVLNKERQEIKGVVFYDADNILMMMETGKEAPIPLSASKLLPHERFTFYDQKHTSGADIKQASTATAIVTIGRHTLLRDLLQSVWRLRGLDKSQKVNFTIDQEVKELIISILKEMGISVSEPLQLEHLLIFASYNQAMLQGDNNFRALKHKSWEVLQQEVFRAFLDPNLDGKHLAELFNSVSHLFIQNTTASPWQLFGEPNLLVDSHIAAKEQVEKVKNCQAFEVISKSSPKIADKLNSILEKTLPLLPNKVVKSNAVYGREVEAETEKEQNKEKEAEIEKNTEVRLNKYAEPPESAFKSCKLSDAFLATKGLASFANIFDEDLLASWNFLLWPSAHQPPNSTSESSNPISESHKSPPFGVFNEYQKPVCGLRVTPDNKVVMVDQKDAKDADILYDLSLGLYRCAGNPSDFLDSKKFLRKVVQAKFFNGETYYKKEEKDLLREWIEEKGVDRMRDLFVNHILKFKEESRGSFPGSVLDTALKQG